MGRNSRGLTNELIIDSFAGGGGASLGIQRALGRSPDISINHDAAAVAMHAANHPDSHHVMEDVWHARLKDLTKGRPVGLLWASPDCKHFSRAKGGKPVEKGIRSLAWVIVRWANQARPRVIILENVREFEEWGPVVPRWKCSACTWKGTEGQATLDRNRRRCPHCESLRLSISDELVPDPTKRGMTFRLFVNRLRGFGYQVQWRNLNAADFGAPTHRRRLFLIARRDGQPIQWPEPTHADPKKLDAMPLFDRLLPYRTAAECIDWSIPCPSIFERERPLAEKTLRRIALGIKRYVLDCPKPFIVPVTHVGERRSHPIDEPLPTVTSARRGEFALISPTMIQTGYGERQGQQPRVPGLDKPLGTVVGGGAKHALIAGALIRSDMHQSNAGCHYDLKEPLRTITSACGHALIAGTLIEAAYGSDGRWGDGTKDINKPLGTIHAGGNNHALVTAYLAKHFGGMVGVPADTPLPTITSIATQNQIVAANLVHLNHGEKQWSSVEEPLRTVTTGKHAALVYSFLVKYFGTAIGQSLHDPLHTVTSNDRFGLVTVTIDGEPYILADIGMRMLTPRELARAQGFPDSYVLTGSKTSQVARIGNSVAPIMAELLVRANVDTVAEVAA